VFPQVSLLVEDLPQAFFQVHLLVFSQVEAEVGVEVGVEVEVEVGVEQASFQVLVKQQQV